MALYLIHFETPFKHARHYLGYTETEEGIQARIERHRAGNGAKLMRAITQAGINWSVVRVWPDGDRNLERRLKNSHGSAPLCPVCIKEKQERKTHAQSKHRADSHAGKGKQSAS